MEIVRKEVKIIKPTLVGDKTLRVAAYCRVSTDSTDQANSFFAQVKYYNDFIRASDRMTLVDIYADEGITGTSVDKRDEFKRMMKDAKNRKIDRVLVKSVTRFARNSMECIEAVRKLKSYGVTVLFENDHIDTDNMNSEMILYIKSAFAQEEALSASKRMSTSIRMRMENGSYVNPSVPYGYTLVDGNLTIVETEAEKVRQIFQLYIDGYGYHNIAKIMQQRERDGKKWGERIIESIIHNERYIGDTLWQKRFTPSMLPLKEKRNNGELPKFYVENSHEGIVSREVFKQANTIRVNRGKKYYSETKTSLFFQGVIFCRHCGWQYRKIMRKGSLYWTCSRKGMVTCHALTYSNAVVEQAFVKMYNTLKKNSKALVDETIVQLVALKTKVNSGNDAIGEIDRQLALLSEQNSVYNELHISGMLDEVTYMEKTDRIKREISELRTRRSKLINEDENEQCIEKLRQLKRYLDERNNYLVQMDEGVFKEIVEKIYAEEDGALTFRLKCELEFKVYVGRQYGK